MSLRFSARKAPTFQLKFMNERQFRLAAQPGLPCSRDHLLKRRIACQRIGQTARIGRIGAAEFDRGRRAAALRIARIGVHGRDRAPGEPDGRVEALKYVVAIERARSGDRIDPVGIVDCEAVVAPGYRQIQVLGECESVGEIEAPVGSEAVQVDARVDREPSHLSIRPATPERR